MSTWTKPRKNGFPTPGQPQRQTPASPTPKPADPDRVRARAYEIFLARRRDNAPGNPESDWLQAERELVGKLREQPRSHAAIRGEALLHDDD